MLHPYQDQLKRLAEVPGLGVDSAQQILAEVGSLAAAFPSPKHLSSWVGACPDNESAGVNYGHRSPKGNRAMRRVLNQCANAAVKAKGTIFEVVYRRSVSRLGHKQNDRGHCPSAVSPHLEDLARWSSLRRTRLRRQPRIEAKTRLANDSRTAKPRRSSATREPAAAQSSMRRFSTLKD